MIMTNPGQWDMRYIRVIGVSLLTSPPERNFLQTMYLNMSESEFDHANRILHLKSSRASSYNVKLIQCRR